RPPPCSTLFPYTTLFRSRRPLRRRRAPRAGHRPGADRGARPRGPPRRLAAHLLAHRGRQFHRAVSLRRRRPALALVTYELDLARDRKSTRLNSSLLVISY